MTNLTREAYRRYLIDELGYSAIEADFWLASLPDPMAVRQSARFYARQGDVFKAARLHHAADVLELLVTEEE
jgi:hypothetical protein